MNIATLTLACLMLANSPDVVGIQKRNFMIPIQLDPARRAQIKDIKLWVSSDQGATWQLTTTATANDSNFSVNVPADGTYWFSLSVVDPQNIEDPPDIKAVPPARKILVDTVRPSVQIGTAERQGDDAVVSWEIQEAHPDLGSLKMEYRQPDPSGASYWVPATITVGLTGQARFRVGPGPIQVRLEMKDQAENTGTAEREIAARATAPVPPPIVTPPPPPPGPQPLPPVPPAPYVRHDTYTPPGPPAPPPYPPAPPAYDAGARQIVGVSGGDTIVPPRPIVPAGNLPPANPVNDRQVSMDYELDQVGPSKVAKVELWITADDGRTWKYLADDPDRASPITANLPGEGVYGLRLVTQSGAGLGEGPPQAGEAPDIRLDVDLTPPAVKLFEPRPEPARHDTLILSWTVTDNKSLQPRPIRIEWTENPLDRNWTVIVAEHPNSGSYSWQLPPNIPQTGKIYLRCSAMDTAGNRGVAETPEAILVDLNKPKAKLVRLTKRETPAHAPTPSPFPKP